MLQQKQDFPLTIEAIQHSRQKNYFDQALAVNGKRAISFL